MLSVSSPPNTIVALNVDKRKNLEALFEFTYLTNDGPLLLTVLEEKFDGDDVKTFTTSYGFVLEKYWWGLNKFSLRYPLVVSLMVLLKHFNHLLL